MAVVQMRLDEAVDQITVAVLAKLTAAQATDKLLEGVGVKWGREAVTSDLPVLFVNPLEAVAGPPTQGLHVDWRLPIFLVAMVKNTNDPAAGQKEAMRWAGKASQVLLADRTLNTTTARLVKDVRSARFNPNAPTLEEYAIFVGTVTLEVWFGMIEQD